MLTALFTLFLVGGCDSGSSQSESSEGSYYTQPPTNQPIQPPLQQPSGQSQGEASLSCENLRELVEKNRRIGESAMSAAKRSTSPAGTTGQSMIADRAFSRVEKYLAEMSQKGCTL